MLTTLGIFTGDACCQDVADIPEPLTKALQSAFTRYWLYLDSIDEDEGYLKKKVELDLGSKLLQVKQRCTGLEPEWGEVSRVAKCISVFPSAGRSTEV